MATEHKAMPFRSPCPARSPATETSWWEVLGLLDRSTTINAWHAEATAMRFVLSL